MEDAENSVVTHAIVSMKRKDVDIANGESSCYESEHSYCFEVQDEGEKGQVNKPAVTMKKVVKFEGSAASPPLNGQ